MEDKKRINIVVDPEFHREVKIAVAKQNTTIQQFVIEAIKEKIEKNKK